VMPGLDGNPYYYNPQGLAKQYVIPTLDNNTIWLTDEQRVDRDSAAFAQMNWDITSHWQLTGGFRQYHYDNSLQGFYGYSANYQTLIDAASGMLACGPPGHPGQTSYAPFHFAPCTDLNLTSVSASGHTELGRLTYKFDADHLVYATYSTGFRPGGVNRVYDVNIKAIYPPYGSDELKNYEIGWKTQWLNGSLRWNGAIFVEDWNNFQFSYLGPNSVTVVQNAASAQSRGVEMNFAWAPGNGWNFSGSATWLDAKLTSNFCGTTTLVFPTSCPTQQSGASGSPIQFYDGTVAVGPYAPNGAKLPGTPDLKANLISRYNFPLGDWKAYGQVAYVYQDASVPLLFPAFYTPGNLNKQHLTELSPYNTVDLATGAERNGMQVTFRVQNVTDDRGQITKFSACTPTSCNQPYIIPIQPRTYWIQFGQKF